MAKRNEEATDSSTWLTKTSLARMLEVRVEAVAQIAEAAGVRSRKLPGLRRVEYLRADAVELAKTYGPHGEAK